MQNGQLLRNTVWGKQEIQAERHEKRVNIKSMLTRRDNITIFRFSSLSGPLVQGCQQLQFTRVIICFLILWGKLSFFVICIFILNEEVFATST